MKKKTKKKKKVVRRPAVVIPKDLKPFVVKRYRTKDRSKKILVVRMSSDKGFSVQTLAHGQLSLIREFLVPTEGMSEIPLPVWLTVQRELARWYASQMARKGVPSEKQERSRRRRIVKHAFHSYVAHQETKAVVTRLTNGVHALPPTPPLKLLVPYICIYDPRQSLGKMKDKTFEMHTALCGRLDGERKRMLKRGGDSWVVEAHTIAQAQALQMAEFAEEGKGYDETDFGIHECGLRGRSRITSKTVLGRVSNKQRRGRRS